jgi:hypothetical protein
VGGIEGNESESERIEEVEGARGETGLRVGVEATSNAKRARETYGVADLRIR